MASNKNPTWKTLTKTVRKYSTKSWNNMVWRHTSVIKLRTGTSERFLQTRQWKLCGIWLSYLLRKLIGKNIYDGSCTFICDWLCPDCPARVMHSKKQWQTSVKCQSMSSDTVYNIRRLFQKQWEWFKKKNYWTYIQLQFIPFKIGSLWSNTAIPALLSLFIAVEEVFTWDVVQSPCRSCLDISSCPKMMSFVVGFELGE
jgi:hypothetical protein